MNPSPRVSRSLLLIVQIALLPAVAQAQSAPTVPAGGLAGLLPTLILREIRLPEPPTGFSHSAHFSPLTTGELSNPVVGIVNGFNTLMTLQLSTFPLGSSAGGFTYAFDPALGTFRRSTSSFGPSFAERATTIGRRRMSGGFTYQHTRYNSFEGVPLDDGSIKFYLRHRECCSAAVPPATGTVEEPNGTRLNPFFEGDVIEAALSVKVKTDTVALFATYGATDRLDLGVAVPILRVDLEANVLATVQRLATVNTPNIHTFVRGDPSAISNEIRSRGTATGLGDIVVRAKYRLLDRSGGGGLAAAADVRLPTGDEQDLLGGATQGKFYLAASRGGDALGYHVNVGYTFSGSVGRGNSLLGDLPDEINYAAGGEYVAHPKLTLIGDLNRPLVARRRTAQRPGEDVSVRPDHRRACHVGAVRRVRAARRRAESVVRHRRREVQPVRQFPNLRRRAVSPHGWRPPQSRHHHDRDRLRILIDKGLTSDSTFALIPRFASVSRGR